MCFFYQKPFKYIAKKEAKCYLSVSEVDKGNKIMLNQRVILYKSDLRNSSPNVFIYIESGLSFQGFVLHFPNAP
jgi:hypothetical protein